MRVFLAGASGAIGRRLVPLLLQAGHEVTGTTRSVAESERARAGRGRARASLDVFDAQAMIDAVAAARARGHHPPAHRPAARIRRRRGSRRPLPNNARIRVEGTRNLIAAAQAAVGAPLHRAEHCFAYAPGGEPHPRDRSAQSRRSRCARSTVKGAADMEQQVLAAPGIDGIVLRYGLLYGPGTWYEASGTPSPALHVDAAAQAALLAVTRGAARHLQHRRRRWRGVDRQGACRARLRSAISTAVNAR